MTAASARHDALEFPMFDWLRFVLASALLTGLMGAADIRWGLAA